MSTKTEICNLAIAHLGVGAPIADLDTDNSNEAEALRRFYPVARDMMLRELPWGFAKKTAVLGLIEEDPTDEWGYSYTYPSDCVMIRKLQSAVRVDSTDNLEPYEIAHKDGALCIFTDVEDAVLQYTVRIPHDQLFPADFVMAFSLKLAILIAARLGALDDKFTMTRITQLYQYEMAMARAASMREAGRDIQPDSEFIRARD